MSNTHQNSKVHSTAGAVPVKNEKGQITMVKVKVQRYVSGKKPDFASSSSSDSESEPTVKQPDEIKAFQDRSAFAKKPDASTGYGISRLELGDPRFRRLMQAKEEIQAFSDSDNEDNEDRIARHKKLRRAGSDQSSDESSRNSDEDADEEYEEELDEAEIVRRRQLIRQRALAAANEDAESNKMGGVWPGENASGGEEGDLDEELDYSEEEYTSSDDEVAPKLKPVFVRARDRITLQEKHKAEMLAEEQATESKRLTDERRRTTLKLLENELRREAEEAHAVEDALDALDSDQGQGDAQAEQENYEKWKVRELKRIRRDREAREAIILEKQEIESIRAMTDQERREEFARNPKKVTNPAVKGKYRFLQKYYHRGAFFVSDLEDKVFQQDFTQPTLEDHFDKTKLPAVMQVKNFGRAGRTKYTHLVDQDTTTFESPWSSGNPVNVKFQSNAGGGFKQIFEAPGANRRKANRN